MRHSLAVILLLTLTACSSTPTNDELSKKSAEEMYNDAKSALLDENYESAIKKFESLQSRFPYGRFAQQGQLEIAYAYYKQNEVESAIAAADRFIKQYPNSPTVEYAYYLKGLAMFHGETGLFGLQGDPTERDPKAAQDSFAAFKDLVVRFPDSKYAADSRVRMQYLINALAKYAIHVADYYQRRGAHIAAVNRAKEVLTLYPTSLSTRDALKVLVTSYSAMDMTTLSNDAQRVLDLNTPAVAAVSLGTNYEQAP
ncbi:MAG: outer membrane protein assembly factor BamD [Gallionella sp.]